MKNITIILELIEGVAQNLKLTKVRFTTISQNWSSDGHFEVLNGSKVMKHEKHTKKQKSQKTIHRLVFFTKLQKNESGNIYNLCNNFWAN